MRRQTYSRASGVARGLGVLLVCFASTAAFAGPRLVDETDVSNLGDASNLGLMITANELEGSSVVNLSGKEVARIEGLLINPKSGQVEYVALRFQPEGETLALPWSALAFEGTHAILDATDLEIDEAPRVEPSMFGLEGKPRSNGAVGKETSATTAQESEPVEAMKGYAPLKAFENRFDPKQIETLQGVIRGTVATPLEGPESIDEIAFLETAPRTSVLLALAPSWYLKKQHLDLVPTEKVKVTGSQVASEVGPLLVVTTIEAGDRTIELRTNDGKPLWRQSS